MSIIFHNKILSDWLLQVVIDEQKFNFCHGFKNFF